MKTTLVAVALLASQLCLAQRIRELTNSSWDHPDLSVEHKGDLVISGFTERNPSGILVPAFKINNAINGAAIGSFRLNYPDPVYLMDFQIRQNTTTLVFVGMVAAVGTGTPYKMIIGEWNYSTGAIVQSTVHGHPDNIIPHQVIVSQNTNQVVVVGTRISGALTPTNYAALPKWGFVHAVSLTNMSAVVFTQQMNTPNVASDNDILECITEIPGTGYFIGGSANNPTNGEQNVFTMGVNYGGGIMHSRITDNTNFRGAAASVMYTTLGGASVWVLANSSSMHQFQLARCNPGTGAFMGANWVSHQITSLPIGAGVDQNGFRLMQYPAANEIILGGYLTANTGAMPQQLTPYQMTLNPGLTFLSGKYFQSGNNAPLTGYFEEWGNSIYANTPDMLANDPASNRTYLVSQNNVNGGFDLNLTTTAPASNSCERPLPTTSLTRPILVVGSGTFPQLAFSPLIYMPSPSVRPMAQSTLCESAVPPAALTIWPNPATEQVQLTLGDGATPKSVTVYDLNGKVVLEITAAEKTRGRMTLDISVLRSGAYIVHLTDTEGVIYRDKFVKE